MLLSASKIPISPVTVGGSQYFVKGGRVDGPECGTQRKQREV